MTDREKAVVMAYTGITMLQGNKLGKFYAYIEELMGRPIYTHEIYAYSDKIKEMAKPEFLKLCAETTVPRMQEKKIDEITTNIRKIFLDGAEIITKIELGNEEERDEKIGLLLDTIASLHNELYKEVTGKYYDYMFHWANLGYCGTPNDALFKEKEKQENENSSN